ncbi:MAG: hypothetical protein KDA32_05115 [Phycisphaerales bacterium]|nr:hypothetical protein [Phycisphaerales bacterium]
MRSVTSQLAMGLAAGFAHAQTITVTTGANVNDINWQTGTIADLPGADGEVSFTEAMIAANNTPGHQTIAFAIPQASWDFQFLFPGRAVVHTDSGIGIRAFDEVTIDGTTQTAFTGDTNPDGAEVAFYPGTLYLNADNSTIAGIDSVSVNLNGSNAHAYGLSGGNISLFGGSGSLIENNVTGTIKIDRSNDNVVVGNICQRVRVLGFVSEFGTGPATANRIGGPTLAERNYITGYGTWDGEGFPGGVTVQIFDTTDTLVENNWIGTTPDGLAQGSLASTVGVGFEGENHDVTVRDNRIAGILGHCNGTHCVGQVFGSGVYFNGSGSGFQIVGNTIGLDANDEPLGSVFGIDVGYFNFSGIDGVQIGGTAPGEGNIISGHLFNGITVQREAANVHISGNSIYGNQGLGIDLVPMGFGYGVTPNDPLDTDDGGNGLQNFPELLSATRQGASLRVVGNLASSPTSDFTIEFFASPQCDDSGFGAGEFFLGATAVSTDASGLTGIDATIGAIVPDGWVITATATLEPMGPTSEFSACVTATGVGTIGDLDGDGDVDLGDLAGLLAAYGSCAGDPEFVVAADADLDGCVALADLAALLSNFGV